MVPHSSTVAWKIPWTEEPDRLQSMGSHGVGHNWSDLAAVAVIRQIASTKFFMESQRVGHDWATELNWTEAIYKTTLKMAGE